nr:hypothetical protein [Tanacetum cinerariifolium]
RSRRPPGFQDPEFPARVYKVEKAMYGLHQASRAWYGTLSKCLLSNGFQRDDIIFGSSNPQLCREFEALMHEKFQMSAMVYQMDVKSASLYGTIDEEVYVMQPLGFQDPEFPARVYKVEKAMYRLHQASRAWYGTLSKCLLSNGFQRDVKSANTPMDKENPWGKDGTGRRLISWQRKKQIIVATSTTEAEYVAAAGGCGQVLWIQNRLLDYGLSKL